MKTAGGFILIATGLLFLYLAATGKIPLFTDFLKNLVALNPTGAGAGASQGAPASQSATPTGNSSGVSASTIGQVMNLFSSQKSANDNGTTGTTIGRNSAIQFA